MVDSKHDVISKSEKHDWTFFAFFAIALILIASAIVWATAKAGMFNANSLDDDTPQRVSLPAMPVPSAPSSTSPNAGSTNSESSNANAVPASPDSEPSSPNSATIEQPQSPDNSDNITPSAGPRAAKPEK